MTFPIRINLAAKVDNDRLVFPFGNGEYVIAFLPKNLAMSDQLASHLAAAWAQNEHRTLSLKTTSELIKGI